MAPVKTLLILLCAFSLAAHADAASRFAGKYVGFLYSRTGDLEAGVNVTVQDDGTVVGRGTFLDFTEINLTGSVDDGDGTMALEETDGHGDPFAYTSKFTFNGKKFVTRFDDGEVFRGKRLSGSHPEAGVYYVRDDDDEDAVVFINRAGLVYGVIYDRDGDAIDLAGNANVEGLRATSADGVDYEGVFDGDDLDGTYDDGEDFYGDFTGSKY